MRYCYIYLLKSEYKTFEMFKYYKNKVENQRDKKLKVIKSDRGCCNPFLGPQINEIK